MGRRVRVAAGLWALAELVVFVAVASWIGVGWTILATLATSALGGLLLARQGTRTLAELRERARTRQPPGRALGDAGLIAVGGLLMLLPGFIGDLAGLLCLLPVTRALPRALLGRLAFARVVAGPVRVRSTRIVEVDDADGAVRYAGVRYADRQEGGGGATRATPLVIEGEVAGGPPGTPD